MQYRIGQQHQQIKKANAEPGQPIAWIEEFTGELGELSHGNVSILRLMPESPVSVIFCHYAIFSFWLKSSIDRGRLSDSRYAHENAIVAHKCVCNFSRQAYQTNIFVSGRIRVSYAR
jgi:hypothetical protein